METSRSKKSVETITKLLAGDLEGTVTRRVLRDYNAMIGNKPVPEIAYLLGHAASSAHLEAHLREVAQIAMGEERIDVDHWKALWRAFAERFGKSVDNSSRTALFEFVNEHPVVVQAQQSAIQELRAFYECAETAKSNTDILAVYASVVRACIQERKALDHHRLHEELHLALFDAPDLKTLISTKWKSLREAGHATHFAASFVKDTGTVPSINDIRGFKSFMANPVAITDMYMERVRASGPHDLLLAISDIFVGAMRREPIIHELQYVFRKTRGNCALEEIEKEVQLYSRTYAEYVVLYENIRKEYLLTPSTPAEFARVLVPHTRASKDEFVSVVQEAFVSCDEYEHLMSDRVRTVAEDFLSDNADRSPDHSFVFTDGDIDYMTNCARAFKLSHLSEETSSFLKALLQRHSEHCERIHAVYASRLKRRAEASELAAHIEDFRAVRLPTDDSESRVLDKIDSLVVSSLEFHEILKAHIVETAPGLTRAQTFSVLTEIVHKGTQFYSNLEKVTAYILQKNMPPF